jgi:hypothetical protein
MVVRLSALCAGRPLPPGRFLVLIFVRGWVDLKSIMRLEGLGKLRKSDDFTGNWTCDLPACSIVPQPTMLLHWCAVQYEINGDVMKCMWNKMVFNAHSCCINKLKIKTKFHCYIKLLKLSGSFVTPCVRLWTPGWLTILTTCLYDSDLQQKFHFQVWPKILNTCMDMLWNNVEYIYIHACRELTIILDLRFSWQWLQTAFLLGHNTM